MLTERASENAEAESVAEFTAHLRKIADLRAENKARNPLHVWPSVEELLLTMVGEPVRVSSLALPERVAAGPLKACFNNAFSASAQHPHLRYAEGYAFSGFFPVSHAWCVDVETGAIVDPTWVSLDYEGPFLYLGLTFSREFMARLVDETHDPSVFESDWTRRGRTTKRGLVLDPAGHVADWGDPPPF